MSRVLVVGGGLAGIAAALDCADAGAEVTLVETRPRLGGAAYSFDSGGLTVDNGQHVFLRCCTAYRELLARLGSESETRLQHRLDIPVRWPGGGRARIRRDGLPAPLHLAGGLARYSPLSPFERLSAVRAAWALGRLDPTDPRLDERAFGDWLAEHGQGPNAVGALWDLVALPTLNLPAAEASLGLAAFVFRTGLLDDAAAGDIGWARVPLSRLHDEPARQALADAGVEVRLRWRGERLERTGAGFLVTGRAGEQEADAVIVALPHERAARFLGRLAPPGLGPALRALGSSPIVDVHVVYDRPVLDEPFVAAIRSPVQYAFDRTASAGVESGQYVAISLSGAKRWLRADAEVLRETLLAAMAELFPAARAAHVEHFLVTREHAATFRAEPGSAALRPGPRTPTPGLVLAGAWTATGWPATMEGAVRSGHAAAREALAALEAPRVLEAVA